MSDRAMQHSMITIQQGRTIENINISVYDRTYIQDAGGAENTCKSTTTNEKTNETQGSPPGMLNV